MVGGTFALEQNATVVVEVVGVLVVGVVSNRQPHAREDDGRDDGDEVEADKIHGAWRSCFHKQLLPHKDYELKN